MPDRALVIVESPAKVKTISKYLGKNYIVKSSIGHIRDLPKQAMTDAQGKKINKMGIEPENNWHAHYQIIPGKEKVVQELFSACKKVDQVILATDPDREGEAIAWHLQEVLKQKTENPFYRVTFNEITKNAVTKAFEQLGHMDSQKVDAQQTRRFLDRIVGFKLSPLLWAKIARGLSAGRVQSVALRLVVEREKEIQAFNPKEYWTLAGLFSYSKKQIIFDVLKYQGKKFAPENKQQIDTACAALEGGDFVLSKNESKPTTSRPYAPFITSSLQQGASTRLGFGVKRTMGIAQKLYEAGLITYMRTDSTHLSTQALDMIREYIGEQFAKEYLPAKPNVYKSKGNAQEAHEAIRPTDIRIMAQDINADPAGKKLYELIWRQTLASQMTPAQYLNTTLEIDKNDYTLIAKGRVKTFDGFTKILPDKDDSQKLPAIEVGSKLHLEKLDPKQHFTKPPKRFSESGLVKELEKRGIGRPSTYAAIISTIQDRGYVRLENKSFIAEKIGQVVVEQLSHSFEELMDYNFTANMEERLDQIAHGQLGWKTVLDEFYHDFSEQLELAASSDEKAMQPNIPVPTEIICPNCGEQMLIRVAATGMFLSCAGYANKGDAKCTTTMNLMDASEIVEIDENGEVKEEIALLQKKRCPKCSLAMTPFLVDTKRKIHICANNPRCTGVILEEGAFKLKDAEGPTIECDKCQSTMEFKSGRFGKYFACTNTENCKNTRKVLANGQPAPPKMTPIHMQELRCTKVDDYYLLRDGAAGLFLAASKFPKNRETRPVQVLELLPHKDELDPKYHYLLDAPKFDNASIPTQIRFSRKKQMMYVMSEKDGKPTKWIAEYVKGAWKVTLPKVKK